MGHSLKLQCSHSPLNLRILTSTCVPFTPTTVQVPNLALTRTKRITVRRLTGTGNRQTTSGKMYCLTPAGSERVLDGRAEQPQVGAQLEPSQPQAGERG
jgi:hypothetical protein